jgi:outer membrane receptor protein involved in Fe transport
MTMTVLRLLAAVSLSSMAAAGAHATAITPATATPSSTLDAADPGAPSAPTDIVVTATRRSSSVQSTPVSITAVGQDEIARRGVVNFTALAQSTPGISMKSEGPGQTEIELRGMTSSGGNSPTVGFYLDDVPLTAPSSAQNGKVVIDPALYDLNRVEVLRGPQGTLYGAGSMGGTVRLITNTPDTHNFSMTAQSTLSGTEGGGFNHAVNGMVNIPLISDQLALRVVGTENYTSGWIDRVVAGDFPLTSPNGAVRGDVADAPVIKRYKDANADQLWGFRASLLWQPSDSFSDTPTVMYQHNKQDGISAYDSDPGTLAHYQPFDVAEPSSDRIFIISNAMKWDVGAVTLSSSTAYWNRRSIQTEDASEDFNNVNTGVSFASNNGLPNPGYYGPNGTGMVSGTENDPSHQFSQELRVSSNGDHRFNWIVGAFYSDFGSTWNFAGTTQNPSAYMDLGTFAPATTPNWFDVFSPTTLKQYALYGNGTYKITPTVKLEMGLRYYHYDYTFSSTISGWGSGLGAATPSATGLVTQKADDFNPRFNLSYEPSNDLLVYATIARGSRPGGGDAKYPTTGPYWSAVFAPYNYTNGAWPKQYGQDHVWSYELGNKLRLFDRRLTFNWSAYFEDWQNIQLEALPGDWQLNINGNDAKIWGGEAEAKATLGGGFDLSLSGSYTHARVDSGPHWQIVPANVLSDVAPWTAHAVLDYTHELSDRLTLTATVDNTFVGPRYSLAFPFGFTTNGTYINLPSYDLTNFRIGVSSIGGWKLAAFVNNAFNKHAQLESLFQETLPSAAFNRIITNQPLTAGIDLSIKI